MQAARPLAGIRPKGQSFATVLSIDGGGVRGIIAARLLAELERRTQRRTSELFDLVAGTGSGGTIVLALAAPGAGSARCKLGAADLVEFCREVMPRIYLRRLGHRIRTLGGSVGPRYPGEALQATLRPLFGEQRLYEASTAALATAYDLGSGRPCLFRSYRAEAEGDPVTDDHFMWEAACSSWAVPTYFPPHRLQRSCLGTGVGPVQGCIVSGDVFANNPAACAVADSAQLLPGRQQLVVSLGTAKGERKDCSSLDNRFLGCFGLARPILHATSEAQREAVDAQLGRALATTYFRFQVEDVSVRADDASPDALRCLQQAADELIVKAAPQLARVARLLLENLDGTKASALPTP
jgi:hypothetical protein